MWNNILLTGILLPAAVFTMILAHSIMTSRRFFESIKKSSEKKVAHNKKKSLKKSLFRF